MPEYLVTYVETKVRFAVVSANSASDAEREVKHNPAINAETLRSNILIVETEEE